MSLWFEDEDDDETKDDEQQQKDAFPFAGVPLISSSNGQFLDSLFHLHRCLFDVVFDRVEEGALIYDED